MAAQVPDPAGPARAPARDSPPLYYTMVVTQKLSSYNNALMRHDEYLLWIVANLSEGEGPVLLTGAPGSEAMEIVEHEIPLAQPSGYEGIMVRLFFQPEGRNGLIRRPNRRDYFVFELFQAQNNLGPPVITRDLTLPSRP